PARAAYSQGHPVPPVGDAPRLPGGAGEGPRELPQPPPAPRRPAEGEHAAGDARGDRPAHPDRPVVAADDRRQQVRPAGAALRDGLGPGAKRQWQLPRAEVPTPRRVLLLPGSQESLRGEPAGSEPRAVLRRSGAAALRRWAATGLSGGRVR